MTARRQECSRCGLVLEDWTGSHGMTASETGETATPPPLWPVGKRIAVSGNGAWVVDNPDSRFPVASRITDEECRPTS